MKINYNLKVFQTIAFHREILMFDGYIYIYYVTRLYMGYESYGTFTFLKLQTIKYSAIRSIIYP